MATEVPYLETDEGNFAGSPIHLRMWAYEQALITQQHSSTRPVSNNEETVIASARAIEAFVLGDAQPHPASK